MGIMDPATSPAAPYSNGRLHSRPGQPPGMAPLAPGVHNLEFPDGRSALIYAPLNTQRPMSLYLQLHGVSGLQGGADHLALTYGARNNACVLIPRSQGASWDMIHGAFGPDLEFLDRLLHWTLMRYPIAVGCMAIGGFSDGASYALSVGLMNGDLFHDVLAFSPGFMRPLLRVGRPRVFICHGTGDAVLAVARGRDLAQQLDGEGYAMQYEEFDGGHLVPPGVAGPALQRALEMP